MFTSLLPRHSSFTLSPVPLVGLFLFSSSSFSFSSFPSLFTPISQPFLFCHPPRLPSPTPPTPTQHLCSPGRVVTITSGLARMAVPMRSAYITSKFAAEGFCDVLRWVVIPVYLSVYLSVFLCPCLPCLWLLSVTVCYMLREPLFVALQVRNEEVGRECIHHRAWKLHRR